MNSFGLLIENGILQARELFAEKVKTKQLCIEENGEEVCITKDQLKELLSRPNSPTIIINQFNGAFPPLQNETPANEPSTEEPASPEPEQELGSGQAAEASAGE